MQNKNTIIKSILIFATFLVINSIIKVKADTITPVFDQLSRVSSNTAADHNIYFVLPGGISAGQEIRIFLAEDGFMVGSSYDYTDMTLSEGDSDNCFSATFTSKTLGAAASGSTWGAVYSNTPEHTFLFTSDTDTIDSNMCVKVQLNSNGVNHTITNSNETANAVWNGSVTTLDSGDPIDYGEFSIIILGDVTELNNDQIQLNAIIATTLLLGVDVVTDDCNNATQTSPPNQKIDFGILYPSELKLSGSQYPFICIDAGTNSASGMNIYMQSSRNNAVGGLVGVSGTITSTTADLNSATTGYGLRVASLGTPSLGTFAAESPFDSVTTGDIGQISGLLGSPSLIVSANDKARTGISSRIAIEVAVKVGTSSPADNYSDVLTVTSFTKL